MKCKSCNKKYDGECDGREVSQHGMVVMAYGSSYDLNIYQFTLVPGWYCYGCLDREVKEGLCQPLVVWKDIGAAFRFFYPTGKDNVLLLDRKEISLARHKLNHGLATYLEELGIL